MPTRDQVYSIEARIKPRVQMFYITPPYTSHLDDAIILADDSAMATQKALAEEAKLAEGIAERSPFLLHDLLKTAVPSQPEVVSGHIVRSIG